jgi:hypothetical protein
MIGLAPDPARDDGDGWRPRACGGNMDCRELVAGSVLFLPVEVKGGLLYIGDGHAAQGDGELSGTAIECAMEEVQVRLTVRKGMRITGPRVRTAEGWVTLGFGASLDEAAERATSALLDVMESELRIQRARRWPLQVRAFTSGSRRWSTPSRVSTRCGFGEGPRRHVRALGMASEGLRRGEHPSRYTASVCHTLISA